MRRRACRPPNRPARTPRAPRPVPTARPAGARAPTALHSLPLRAAAGRRAAVEPRAPQAPTRRRRPETPAAGAVEAPTLRAKAAPRMPRWRGVPPGRAARPRSGPAAEAAACRRLGTPSKEPLTRQRASELAAEGAAAERPPRQQVPTGQAPEAPSWELLSPALPERRRSRHDQVASRRYARVGRDGRKP
jgi:hypothetical protein